MIKKTPILSAGIFDVRSKNVGGVDVSGNGLQTRPRACLKYSANSATRPQVTHVPIGLCRLARGGAAQPSTQ